MLASLASSAVMGAAKGGIPGLTKARGKYHRRRKALTRGDMADALTISSAISKKAAENFILVRSRRS